MSKTLHKKSLSSQITTQLPEMKIQGNNSVQKILKALSSNNTSQLKNTSRGNSDGILALKLLKYDPQALERRKFQLRKEYSPSTWKISTNMNSEFGHVERVKGKILSGWDMERVNMSKRSYENPKCKYLSRLEYHGIKFDLFSRQFPQELSKTYSKGFNKKLKQIQSEYEKKLFQGNIKTIQEKRQKSIQAIRSRGTKFQLSKDKLFGFVSPKKMSPHKQTNMRNTISHFYETSRSKKSK